MYRYRSKKYRYRKKYFIGYSYTISFQAGLPISPIIKSRCAAALQSGLVGSRPHSVNQCLRGWSRRARERAANPNWTHAVLFVCTCECSRPRGLTWDRWLIAGARWLIARNCARSFEWCRRAHAKIKVHRTAILGSKRGAHHRAAPKK